MFEETILINLSLFLYQFPEESEYSTRLFHYVMTTQLGFLCNLVLESLFVHQIRMCVLCSNQVLEST